MAPSRLVETRHHMPHQLDWEISPLGALREVAAEWDALNRRRGSLPILDFEAVSLLCREFALGDERLAICRSTTGVAALAIIRPRGRGRWETFQPSQAPLGVWLHDSQYAVSELLRGLMDALRPFCVLVGITQQDPEILERPA